MREDEKPEAIIHELMADADNAMSVDCASSHVDFIVQGWFVFPKGSLSEPVDGPA